MMLKFLALLWDGVAPALKNHLWQSTLLLLLAALLTLALRTNHARARYWLWLVASVKFLVPFSLLVALGSHLSVRPSAPPAQASVYVAVDEFSEPFVPEAAAAVNVPVAAPAVAAPDAARMEPLVPRVLAAVWFAGFTCVLCVWGVSWRRVSAAVRNAVPMAEGRELETLRRLQRLGGVQVQIRLMVSGASMEPGVFGMVRPVLIWPEGMSERLDDAHLEAILAHEVCHVRRRDNLTAALHMLVEAVFWFHPLVWWLGARMVEERERACDEEVLRLCNRPEVYAEGILKVCEFCLESPLPCVSGVTGSDLKKRIANVLAAHATLRLGLGKKLLLITVALGAAAVPLVMGQAQAARRMMLAVVSVVPRPVLAWAVAHTPIELEETPSTGLIAEVQADGPAPMGTAATQGDDALGPAFEVATIRPVDPSDARHGWGTRLDASGRFTASGASMSTLVWLAYVRAPGSGNVSGGPKWAQSDWFDISAKVDDAYMGGWDKLSYEQRMDRVRPMIRRLLAERFQLKLRIEMQPTPVYALVPAKGGPKMKEVPAPDPVEDSPKAALAREINHSKPVPGNVRCWGNACIGLAVPMSDAIGIIVGMSRADRMVMDETGLKGHYDFTFRQPPAKDDSAMAEIEDDLGLKFEARTVPMKTYVIDSAEKPSVDSAEATPAVLKDLEANAAPISTWISPVNEAGIATPDATAVISIKFDTVSFKACKEGSTGSAKVTLPLDGDLIEYECQPIARVLSFAFSGPHPFMMTGEPGWVDTDRYTFQAKVAPADVATWQQLDLSGKRVMVQTLLEDLLKVKVHPDPTPHPVYDLVVAKGGPKFKEYQDGESNTLPSGKTLVGRDSSWSPDGITTIQGITIQALAGTISSRVGRQVIDKTGLPPILYDVSLYIPHDHYDASGNTDESPIPRIFDSVKALGLELQSSKGPTYGLVLDHIERPPEN
jgi:uncharacterized protein (TIGR03435 family)